MKYSIRTVAQMTGLSVHTIRAWEKRYGVLSPERTDSNRRVYSTQDVDHLKLLASAVNDGHSIGVVAHLSTEELAQVRGTERPPTASVAQEPATLGSDGFHSDCQRWIDELDGDRLKDTLARAGVALGFAETVNRVITPLLESVGYKWAHGTGSIAQEHLLTATVTEFLTTSQQRLRAAPDAPRILVTTPAGQIHEIGALMVCGFAALAGWQVSYLGPNLPTDEIARAAVQSRSDAIALSIVFPYQDPGLAKELRRLRLALGERTPILIGGQAAPHFSEAIEEIGATQLDSLGDLQTELARIGTRSWPSERSANASSKRT